MSIFLSVTIGLTSAYIYDRRECKRIQKEYVHKVKWMGELPLDAREMPRRLQILAAVVPEDGELDRPGRWFKRYIRVSRAVKSWEKPCFASVLTLYIYVAVPRRIWNGLYYHRRHDSRRTRTNAAERNSLPKTRRSKQ